MTRNSVYLWLALGCLALSLGATSVKADAITDYNLALRLYQQSRWDVAEEACRDFLKNYPQDEKAPLARLYLAQAMVHRQNFQGARVEFRTFLNSYPQHAERPLAMYRVGECSYFLGEFDLARGELSAFLQDHQQHELVQWALVYLGETELRRNDMAAAAAAFEKYRAQFANGALIDDAEFGLARAYEALNKKPEAIQLYSGIAARPSSPRAAEAQFNLGARLYDQGEYEKAAAAFAVITQKFVASGLVSHAEMNAGYAYYQLQKYPEAIARFQTAAQDQNQAANAGYWMGLCHKAANEFDKASAAFSQTLTNFPQSPLADAITFHWGHSELRAGRFAQARQHFVDVADKYPQGTFADDSLYAACEAMLRSGDLIAADELNLRFEKEHAESGLRFVQKLLLARLRIAQATAATDGNAKKELLNQSIAAAKSVVETSQIKETSVSARLQWARALDALGSGADIPDVLKPVFQDTTGIHPQDLEAAHLLRGRALLAKGDYGAAGDEFQAILQQSQITDRNGALSGLVAARAENKQWAEALAGLQQLKVVDTTDKQFSQLAMRAGDLAFAAQAWSEAAQLFQLASTAGAASTYYAAALSGLGHAQYELKDYVAAAASLQLVLDSGSSNALLLSDASHLRALTLRLAEQNEAALAAYQLGLDKFKAAEGASALTGDAKEQSLNAYRCAKGGARVARELNQPTVAETLYAAAHRELKLHPDQHLTELAPLLNEWAEMHYSAENYARSDELYTLLIQEAPASELADDAALILAESLRFGEKLPEATAAFKKLAEDTQADEFVRQRALVHLLDLYAQQGDWPNVEATATAMQTAYPMSEHLAYVTYRQGEAKLKSGAVEPALKILDQLRQDLALKLNEAPPWWPEVWLLLAENYLQQKQYPNVEGTLNDLRQRAPTSPLLYRADLILGRSYENRALWDEARTAYGQVLAAEAAARTESAAEAQFRIAETYMKQKNYGEAFKAYYKVYVGPKFPEWQSYALFQAGICDKAQRNWPGAATSFRDLIKEFPMSESAEKAKAQLEEIAPFLEPGNTTTPNQ